MDELRNRLAQRGHIVLGVLLFNGYEPLDVFGPLELFSSTSSVPGRRDCIRMIVVSADDQRRATPSYGPTTLADRALGGIPGPGEEEVDLLLVPGGMGTRSLQHDTTFISRLAALAGRAAVVATVCTGSLLLGRTGLLDGRRATTNKVAFKEVAAACPSVHWEPSARWSIDGRFYTSSGISAGTDMAYAMIVELLGQQAAHRCAELSEYTASTDAAHDPFAVQDEAAAAPPQSAPLTNPLGRPFRVLVVLYDQFEMLDTFGPIEMFGLAGRLLTAAGQPAACEIVCVAEEKQVESSRGPVFKMDRTFAELQGDPKLAAERFDLLLLPGGIGTVREADNPLARCWLPRLVNASDRVMTVCTGSAILAAMGLLDGRRATTNKLVYHLMTQYGPRVHWVQEARWVVDGKFYTSSGVSAGTDLSLALVKELFGSAVATAVARRAEYEWADGDGTADPFACTIPRRTWSHGSYVTAMRSVLRVVFGIGFALGFKMMFSKHLL